MFKNFYVVTTLSTWAAIFYLLVSTFYLGCIPESSPRPSPPKHRSAQFYYLKDDITKICYARTQVYNSISTTYVPCTELVEKAITEIEIENRK